MSSTTVPTIINDPEGDVYLKSSDGVLFLVQKVQLQVASQVFKEMFEVCITGGAEHEKKLVISLAETQKELEEFLAFLVSCSKRPSNLNLLSCDRFVSAVSDAGVLG